MDGKMIDPTAIIHPTAKSCRECGNPLKDRRAKTGRCRQCHWGRTRLNPHLTEKQCTRCKETKPIAAFNKRTPKYDLSLRLPEPWCRKCKKAVNYGADNNRRLRRNIKDRLAALNHYSNGDGKCACCGEHRIEFLTLDHIHGNGSEHRKSDHRARFLPLWLRLNKYPLGFQVLCYNCNFAKKQSARCPHHKWEDVIVHNFVDIHGTVEIGHGTVIWNGAVICADVKIGKNVCIGNGCFIGKGTIIGNNCRLQSNVFLPPNSRLDAEVFCGPGMICTDDRHPRVGNKNYKAEPPIFERGCSVGAGVVILPGVIVGAGAMVGAGAVVTRNVEPYSTVVGCPAQIIKLKEAI